MSGRHRSYATQQPNNSRRPNNQRGSSFPTGLVALGAAVVLLAGGGYVLYSKQHNSAATGGAPTGSCSGTPVTLTVAASPDIATTLTQLAAAQNTACAHFTVNSAEPAAVAGFLNGTAKGGDVTSAPDVWVPDTSMWVDVTQSTDQGKQAGLAPGVSIADSPMVIGMPKPLADAAGYPGKPFGWQDLLTALKSAKIQIAVPNPTTSGPGLAAIAMIRSLLLASAGTDPAKVTDADRTLTAVYRLFAANPPASLSTLLAALPTTEATSATSGGTGAFPSTEQKILAYNKTAPAPTIPLVGVYPSEGTMMLDYPYLESGRLDPAHKKAAETLLNAVQSPTGIAALNTAGFRDAHGKAGSAIDPGAGLNPAVPPLLAADPTHTAATGALSVWKTLSEQTRGLIVLDVSGSMGLTVPGQFAGDGTTPLTRLQITAQACEGGLPLFGDTSELGVWTFTTKSKADGGGTVHNELVPMGPLNGLVGETPRRGAISAALQGLTVQSGARNGLYDTILDAYKTVLTGWSENKVNAVVVFTDGKDDGLNSMSADQLIGKLNGLKAANPNHPVRVLVVALGEGVDLSTLSKITKAADGKALYAATPQAIGAVVIDGFTSRLGG